VAPDGMSDAGTEQASGPRLFNLGAIDDGTTQLVGQTGAVENIRLAAVAPGRGTYSTLYVSEPGGRNATLECETGFCFFVRDQSAAQALGARAFERSGMPVRVDFRIVENPAIPGTPAALVTDVYWMNAQGEVVGHVHASN
jgi:hypothetical protein